MSLPLLHQLSQQLEVSSNVLSKIDSVPLESLDFALASSCRAELDESIRLTKTRIYNKLRAESSGFQSLLYSAKSLQQRLGTLSTHVQSLDVTLSDPKSGLVSVLLEGLEAHQSLAQESLNALVLSASLSHLSTCDAQLDALQKFVDTGDLPQAVAACNDLRSLLIAVPESLKPASVVFEMQSRLRTLGNRVEELLSNAFTNGVVVNASEITIKPFGLGPQLLQPLPLSSILSSISSASLTLLLSSLRKAILTHSIESVFDQRSSLSVRTVQDTSGSFTHVLNRLPSPPNITGSVCPLVNISTTLDFLHNHFFLALPAPHDKTFPRSLSKSISIAVLSHLLIPRLPSQIEALPPFLKLVNDAVDLEDKYMVKMLDESSEREIKTWANNVCSHYERQRRSYILDSARELIIQSHPSELTFYAQLPLSQEIPDQVGLAPPDEGDAWGLDDDNDDAWGWNDEDSTANGTKNVLDDPPESGISDSYLVSSLAKSVIRAVENALREGKGLASSGVFPGSLSTTPGTLIMQSGALVLDLYRALYPTVDSAPFDRPGEVMRFSNDCYWLAQEVARLAANEPVLLIKDNLEESKRVFQVLADSWYQDGIERQRTALCGILASAEGFTDTSDQDRYDDCEMALSRVVREIRSVASSWKPVLLKSKYYTAVGAIVEISLQRILQDILAIPDIPDVESHKLSELCRILAALEGLFVEDFSASSFVASYVPLWLKFSYLSELLEASMADFTYLFEEAALVDFEVDELVRIVCALFADTPLRAKTLDKIMNGHPIR